MSIWVYHGGTEPISKPLCHVGRKGLEFIVANRSGLNASLGFDYIEGGIANDRVIDTINLYMAGLMSMDVALKRLSLHQPNNQICLLNQSLTDKFLFYHGTEHAI